MPDATFVDLEVRLLQRISEGYPVEMTLGGQQEFARGFLSPAILQWTSSGDLAADGQRLFNHLLADAKVREAWAQARGQAAQRRLRLRIDPDAAELHALPWELLHDGAAVLAAQADTPFSRYLPIARPWSGAIEQRPIKVLIVISNPDDLESKYDLPQADVSLEEEILEAAFEAIDPQEMQIDFLDAPITLERLEEALRKGYHLLHFLGHGAFNARRGQAALYLQDDEGHAKRVTDDDFANMLARQGVQPRLVFLAACESAKQPAPEVVESMVKAYRGLGPKLVSAGVPAVVAMQDRVTLKSARKFSAAFYQRLVEHGTIDRAMNEARSTLITSGRPDAAVPVLFMRLRSGRLWGEEAAAPAAPALPEVPPAPEPEPPPAIRPFIGREAELHFYHSKLDAQHLAVISGMPGIGKTSLAAELARRTHEAKKTFWHAFHKDEGLMTTIWQLAGFLAWNGQPDLWRMLQRTQQTGGQLPPPGVLLDYLFQMLRGQDYLVCFDDLQLAEDDPLLEQFLQRLWRQLSADGLRLIGAAQRIPAFIDSDEFPPLPGLTLEETYDLLSQHGLAVSPPTAWSRAAVQDTFGLRSGKDLPPEEIVATLHERTSGNPLLLTLAIDGLKRASHPARYLAQLFADKDIERFLLREIDDSLSDTERSVMQALAVLLGYSATRDAIEAVLDGPNVRRTLSDLSERHLMAVAETETDREYMINAVIRTFYYDELSKHQRQIMHQRAAAYYEKDEPDRFRAALHYEAAGQSIPAAGLVVDDVNKLINQGHARGLRYLLERFTSDQLDAELWARVNLARGEVYLLQGESQRAREAYESALKTLESERVADNGHFLSATQRALKAQACRGLADVLRNQAPAEALSWLERGLREVGDDQPLLVAELQLKLSTVLITLGNHAEAAQAIDRALALLPEEPGPLRLGVLGNRAIIARNQGDVDRAIEAAQQAITIAEALHDHFRATALLNNLGGYQLVRGEWASAAATYERGLKLAQQLGVSSYQIPLSLNLGALYLNQGRRDLARRQFALSLELARRSQLRNYELTSQLNLAELAVCESDLDTALNTLAEAERLAQETGSKGRLQEVYWLRAQARLLAAQLAEAQADVEQALQLTRELKMPLAEGLALRTLADIQLAQGNIEAALNAYEHSLTLLASDPYETARTRAAWGHALIVKQLDVERGVELLLTAQTTFEQLGAQDDVASVRASLPG